MKVLQMVHEVSAPGGLPVYVAMLNNVLQSVGHQTHVLATSVGNCEPQVHPLSLGPRMFGFAHEDDNAWSLATFAASLPWVPDIIVTHQAPFPRVAEAVASLAPVLVFQHAHLCHGAHLFRDNDTVCERRVGAGCLPRWYGRRCGSSRDPRAAMQMIRGAPRDRSVLNGVTAVVANSRYLADRLIREGVPDSKVEVLLPGCPTLIGGASQAPCVARSGRPLISYGGRLVHAKGALLLLDAMRELPSATLELAGSGWQESALREHSPTNVTFLGQLSAPRVVAMHSEAWVSAMPSLCAEPFGMAGIEALAAGTPVVALARGGIPEWLQDGVGTLVDGSGPPSPHEFAAALEPYLSSPPSEDTAGRLREYASNNFGAVAFGERVLALLNQYSA